MPAFWKAWKWALFPLLLWFFPPPPLDPCPWKCWAFWPPASPSHASWTWTWSWRRQLGECFQPQPCRCTIDLATIISSHWLPHICQLAAFIWASASHPKRPTKTETFQDERFRENRKHILHLADVEPEELVPVEYLPKTCLKVVIWNYQCKWPEQPLLKNKLRWFHLPGES